MADTVVRTFDLYNTVFYWNGYTLPGYETQINVAKAYYIVQFSSNPVGSQIDFFAELAGQSGQNTAFEVGTTIDTLPYLWGKYWWDEAIYYSSAPTLSTILNSYPKYYCPFGESIGTLGYISRFNNTQNTLTKPYNSILDRLIPPALSASITGFYLSANNLFITALTAIGPGTGTDAVPANSNLIMADTDLTRRITSNLSLTAAINTLYPKLYRFLPYNTSVIGNLIVPFYWKYTMPYEDSVTYGDGSIVVDLTNTTIESSIELTTNALRAEPIL